ncbi:MAG TPA: ABC transporter permease [Bryobacterales bacterium]|nr:ABC transporter permease [Bryobacterales bacterium]
MSSVYEGEGGAVKDRARSTAAFGEAAKVALDSLRGHKLRSFLTLLGIIVATTTLIGVISLINGMNLYIATHIADLGTNAFVIERFPIRGDWTPKKWMEAQRRNPPLNEEEYEFLKDRATLARDVGLDSGSNGRVDVQFGSETVTDVRLRGVSPNMVNIEPLRVAAGRYISQPDDARHLPVAFIGNDLKQQFFPNVEAIGKTILIQGRPFEVVGVAESQGSVFGQSQDKFALIPIGTLFKMWGRRGWMAYHFAAAGPEMMEQTMDQARMMVRAHRHLRPGQDDTFGLFAADSVMALWTNLTGTLAATMVGIVSVFMVVGGVVIMNIMLAAVTERTHEIGIRKSLGARRRDILQQFLVEAAVLAACGGLLGTASAWVVAVAVRNLTPVPMAVPFYAVFLAVGISAGVGLFFGIYPAHRASKLDPIEALRAET